MSNSSTSLIEDPNDTWQSANSLPALLWGLALVTTSLLIASLPQRLNRWTAVSILIVPACGAFQTGDSIFPDEVFVDYYLRFIIILSSHIIWMAFRDAPTAAAHHVKTKEQSIETRNQWLNGYKLLFNSRGIATAWEVPNLLPGYRSTKDIFKNTMLEKNKTGKAAPLTLAHRGKWSAIGTRLGYLMLNFTLLCLYYDFLNPSTILNITPSDFTPLNSYHPFSSLTLRSILTRMSLAVGNFLPDYLILSAYHDIFAVIFIALDWDASYEWPPLFGSISEAYSMRRFWGVFWHKLIYRSFNGHASVISSALGMKQKGMVARIVNNWLVFVLSGVMHGVVPWKMGVGCAWRASAEYWLVQPIAFVVEGAVQWCWGRVRQRKLTWVRREVLDGFERVAGYLWVATWLVWEAPRRNAAVIRCDVGASS